ncbi:ATP-grasp domain-containing protein [Constantimarinum furrinae]|uniref:Prokaryotic glutathione synthetase ATP-binding domain-containing protein n=1 Tax=Constantimarinum furrinae TaxID=2562285 RepID=A0A7G8PS48_9FLAO|nr:hypothetical protein [Constantimarinum furrinae]QNJ97164.1 hypothetical protein ALE3EI_0586 [Constantimarinum furrinae]
MVDVTIVTAKPYFEAAHITPYIQNILDEYELLRGALEKKGLSVTRIPWDDPNYAWRNTKAVVFRTVWDYFHRYDEFGPWMEKVSTQTQLINPLSLIRWNVDKQYLEDLQQQGIPIVPTVFVKKGAFRSLTEIARTQQWKTIVIKPNIGGGAYLTYKIMADELAENEALFRKLVRERDMLVQEYQETITSMGESSLMVFNGTYTHAIVKRAKEGDYRVQDDYDGTVHHYDPSPDEISLAEKVFGCCEILPAYGRADFIWDAQGNPMLSELEIFEPELWIRNYPPAADNFAEGIVRMMKDR